MNAEILQFQHASKDLIKTDCQPLLPVSDLVDLGYGLRVCISGTFLGGADAGDPEKFKSKL